MLFSNGFDPAAAGTDGAAAGVTDTFLGALSRQGLLADLYEFTMAQGYWLKARHKRATFNYFVRRAPFGGDQLTIAGIEPLLDALEKLSFSDSDVAYLASLGHFRPDFLRWLRQFRFRGDVWAIAEGRPAFAGEPLLRVEGSLLEAELVSGLVLSHLNYQTLIATKASRIVEAAAGRPVVELGVRRAHGLSGSVYGSRAAYVAGVDLTSNVLAGKVFGLPVAGTMAHSWVMSFASEAEAFAAFADVYPEHCTLLIDTFGAMQGLVSAVPLLKALQRRGARGLGVRTDSGEPSEVVPAIRGVLDAHGLHGVRIVLSGDLDERRIGGIVDAGLPVDLFGVGSRLISAEDEPALSGVYKLAACGDTALTPCMKHSDTRAKSSLPGAVNVVRFYDADGLFLSDLLVRQNELNRLPSASELARLGDRPGERGVASAEVLLRPVMRGGERLEPAPSAAVIRQRALAERARLPRELRAWNARRERPSVCASAELLRLMGRLRGVAARGAHHHEELSDG